MAISARNTKSKRIKSGLVRQTRARPEAFNFFHTFFFGESIFPYCLMNAQKLSFVSANLYSCEYCTTAAVVRAFSIFCRFSAARSDCRHRRLSYPAVPHKFPAHLRSVSPDAFFHPDPCTQPPPVSALRSLWHNR